MIRICESDTKKLNIFQDKTRVSDYDAMMDNTKLKGDATRHEYYKFEKGYDYYIDYMTAQEYMDMCSEKAFNGRDAYKGVFTDKVNEYAESMKNGDKFPLPYINIADEGQEGRHRMLAGAKAFGEDTEFPVMVIIESNPTESEIVDYCKKAYGKYWDMMLDSLLAKFGYTEDDTTESEENDTWTDTAYLDSMIDDLDNIDDLIDLDDLENWD